MCLAFSIDNPFEALVDFDIEASSLKVFCEEEALVKAALMSLFRVKGHGHYDSASQMVEKARGIGSDPVKVGQYIKSLTIF